MPPILRILVVDDVEPNRRLLCRFITTLGHQVIAAENGEQAVAACRQALPDVILMDILMPLMNGIQAASEIRALCREHWLPIIFLSALGSESEQIEGLTIGDDYLTKPVNLNMLEAKIKVMARIAEMQRKISETASVLTLYQRENEEEQRLTRHILERIIGFDDSSSGPIKRWLKPARNLSGDVIIYEISPSGTLHLMIADSTGHGLAAAVCTLPAVELFYAMTRSDRSISDIARAINLKLNELLPVGRFLAAALLCVNAEKMSLEVWNGGVPAPFLVDQNGQILEQWPSRHLPLGILDDSTFDCSTHKRDLQNCSGEIVVYSDGLLEAESFSGEQFGTRRMHEIISSHAGTTLFASLINAVNTHLGDNENHDDISLAAISCPQFIEAINARARPRHSGLIPLHASEWSLAIKFSAADLRHENCLTVLGEWLRQLDLSERQFAELQLIIAELYNNAVDHGVLGLDSRLRNNLEGLETYQRQRCVRLAALEIGFVEVRIEFIPQHEPPSLRLSIKDSGRGFAINQTSSTFDLSAPQPYGNGIPLVRNLATELHYAADGAEALVDYRLD